MDTKTEIISEIGNIIMRSANASAEQWDYAGYSFETRDGLNSDGEIFMFHKRTRISLKLGREIKTIVTNFKRFREITRVDGDDYWIKCKAVLRRDGDFKMLFEFDDWSRWSITPANVDQAYEILVGDIFPEALTD